jgi:hypothetical protein
VTGVLSNCPPTPSPLVPGKSNVYIITEIVQCTSNQDSEFSIRDPGKESRERRKRVSRRNQLSAFSKLTTHLHCMAWSCIVFPRHSLRSSLPRQLPIHLCKQSRGLSLNHQVNQSVSHPQKMQNKTPFVHALHCHRFASLMSRQAPPAHHQIRSRSNRARNKIFLYNFRKIVASHQSVRSCRACCPAWSPAT